MNPYRKPDQKYYDDYDSYTIQLLKEVEEKEKQRPPRTITIEGQVRVFDVPTLTKFFQDGILRSRGRERYVQERIKEDEAKDLLVQQHKEPKNIKCDTCGTRMFLSGHGFRYMGHDLLFLFDCPKGTHKARKIIHPDGDEIIFPKSRCKACGGEIITTSRTEKFLTIITDKCSVCEDEKVSEYDMTPEPPITEEDREKYCKQFIGKSTFIEDLERIDRLRHMVKDIEEESQEKEQYEVDKIEQLTIPKLKDRLAKISQDAGYIDFSFEKPKMGREVVIEFNLQDPTERKEKESVKTLSAEFNKALFTTNWRLQKTSVSYRMGYIIGKLKGCEDEEGLLKIAKEIMQKNA